MHLFDAKITDHPIFTVHHHQIGIPFFNNDKTLIIVCNRGMHG